MSISPKTSNSAPSSNEYPKWFDRHERTRFEPAVIRRLVHEYTYQFKFVVAERPDLAEIEQYLELFPEIDRERVLLMPEGTSTGRLAEVTAWLEPLCRQLQFSFCPRRQIEWFGMTRGT